MPFMCTIHHAACETLKVLKINFARPITTCLNYRRYAVLEHWIEAMVLFYFGINTTVVVHGTLVKLAREGHVSKIRTTRQVSN
jgi:hypothetical protein